MKRIFLFPMTTLLLLAMVALSSCADDLDKMRKDYMNKPRDPRLEGYWRDVIPKYDDPPVGQDPVKVDTSHVEVIQYTSDGRIFRYIGGSQLDDGIERLYYTVDNKTIKLLEAVVSKKRGGYAQEEIDYRIGSGRLYTPYGEFIRTKIQKMY